MKNAWRVAQTLFWVATIPLFLLFCNLAGQKVGEFLTERITDIWDYDRFDDIFDKIYDTVEDVADEE